jgi:hypothetical protein
LADPGPRGDELGKVGLVRRWNVATPQARNDDPGGFGPDILRAGVGVGMVGAEQCVDEIAGRIDAARLSCGRAGPLHGGGERARTARRTADHRCDNRRKRRRHDHGSDGPG